MIILQWRTKQVLNLTLSLFGFVTRFPESLILIGQMWYPLSTLEWPWLRIVSAKFLLSSETANSAYRSVPIPIHREIDQVCFRWSGCLTIFGCVKRWGVLDQANLCYGRESRDNWKHRRLYLRNRKHFPCFYRVIETGVEVWENEKCRKNTSCRWVLPQLFGVQMRCPWVGLLAPLIACPCHHCTSAVLGSSAKIANLRSGCRSWTYHLLVGPESFADDLTLQ